MFDKVYIFDKILLNHFLNFKIMWRIFVFVMVVECSAIFAIAALRLILKA